MSSKQLTATVKINTRSAEASLKRLSRQINGIQKAINKTNTNTARFSTAIGKVTTATERLRRSTDRVVTSTRKLRESTERVSGATLDAARSASYLKSAYGNANSGAKSLLSTVKKLAATYLGFKGLETVIKSANTLQSAENRLNSMEGGSQELTEASMDKMYAAAQRSRSSYNTMFSNVSKTMALAPDAFQGNVDNAIRFQEIMAKAYTVGGASSTEASTSMYQLVQALGSGVLQGDELRSVREGAPIAYKEIEKFAQKVFDTEESLKDLASQGVITSDIVVAAIMDAEGKIEASFDKTEITFAQAFESIKNTAFKAFEPVLRKLNEALRSDAGQAAIEGISQALIILANIAGFVVNIISVIFGAFGSFFTWCAENWSWLSRLILTILMIIAVAMAVILFPQFIEWISFIIWAIGYYVVLGAQAVMAGIKAAIAWMAANWVLLLIIVAIVAVLAAVIWLADGFSDACGMIVGGIMTAIAFVWNLFLSLVDLVLGIVSAFYNQFASFANFFANVFVDPIGSIIHYFGDMADYVLGVVETIASAIDKLFGSNLAGAVSGWRGSLEAKITETAKKLGNGKYEEKVHKKQLTAESLGLKRWAYGDAYKTGYEWGHAGGEWITDKLSSLGSMLTGTGLPNPNDDKYGVGGSYNPAGANDDILKGLDELNGTADNINDSLDLADDDLEFLRRIADMEWRNEFTTAEIKIDMTNNNTVNSERDLDGIVEYLGDVLRSEMTSVANGVHY